MTDLGGEKGRGGFVVFLPGPRVTDTNQGVARVD